MITEYVKRGYKKGYDENGNLVYKIPLEDNTPVVVEGYNNEPMLLEDEEY